MFVVPTKKPQQQVKSYGGRNMSGLASSLVFTPVAGLELPTPSQAPASGSGDKWFSKAFTRTMPPPPALTQ